MKLHLLILILTNLTFQFDLLNLLNNNVSSSHQNYPQNNNNFLSNNFLPNPNMLNQNVQNIPNPNNNRATSLLDSFLNKSKNNTPPVNNSGGSSILNKIGGLLTNTNTPLDKCDFQIDLSKILKSMPIAATCKPLRMEFEDGINSNSKSVFASQQGEGAKLIRFLVRLEMISFIELAKNKNNIYQYLQDPSKINWKIGNSNDFLLGLDPKNSISCEKVKAAFAFVG
jgi:hypothetical protein